MCVRQASDFATAVEQTDWLYADADTQELTHAVHRYSGKFIPQIAARALVLLSSEGETVVDPYCGSGTTLVEAARLRRNVLGCDLNPLAVLIAKVKTTPIPRNRLVELVVRLESMLTPSPTATLFELSNSEPPSRAGDDSRLTDPWFTKWFQPHVLASLVEIDAAIESLDIEDERNLAKIALSDILRRVSNAHSGYPNVMFDKNAPHKPVPNGLFLSSLRRVCEMVGTLAGTPGAWDEARVLQCDARALPLPDESVDAVVTHPPYIASIPYAEYGALSLSWLGRDPKKLDKELTGGRRNSRDVVDRFKRDYGRMLAESARVLKSGRSAFLMVGNPVVKGELVDLAEMTLELTETAGFKVAARASRAGLNRRANKMGAEHLIFVRKP